MARAQRHELRMRLRTSYVGPVILALLVVSLLDQLISAADQPVAVVLGRLINGFIHRAAPNAFSINQPRFIWEASAVQITFAIGIAIVAVVLASWLYKPADSKS